MATIGIVGGIGPYAGLDLNRKIFDQTVANRDQDHLSVILLSMPREIADRTAYLLNPETSNPVDGIIRCLETLDTAGATVAGIACNTAHSPRIFGELRNRLRETQRQIQLVNMIEEVSIFFGQNFPGLRRVGVLGTDGTIRTNAYGEVFAAAGIQVVYPDDDIQRSRVHTAIYDPVYGIKALSDPVSEHAHENVMHAARHLLSERGAEALILGCTELPLVIKESFLSGKPVVDPTMILARALVARVAPEKLVPITGAAGRRFQGGRGER